MFCSFVGNRKRVVVRVLILSLSLCSQSVSKASSLFFERKKKLSKVATCFNSFDFDSLASAIDDSEVLVDVAVTVDTSLKLAEHVFSVDQLAKDSLVAVKERSLIEGDREFRAG